MRPRGPSAADARRGREPGGGDLGEAEPKWTGVGEAWARRGGGAGRRPAEQGRRAARGVFLLQEARAAGGACVPMRAAGHVCCSETPGGRPSPDSPLNNPALRSANDIRPGCPAGPTHVDYPYSILTSFPADTLACQARCSPPRPLSREGPHHG